MSKTRTISLSLVCMLLAMMLTVSCAKKTVDTQPGDEAAVTDSTDQDNMAMDAGNDSANAEDMAAMDSDEARKEAAGMAQMADDFVSNDVHFDYDSSVIGDSQIPILEAKAEYLRANATVTILVEGHCDERGTTEYNLALGDRRAARVRSFLMDLGIDSSRIETISYGEERPVAMGHTESVWAKNRRAHFIIK